MQNVVVAKLRSDFTAAISSDQNDVTLDPSIASLLDEISQADFLEEFLRQRSTGFVMGA